MNVTARIVLARGLFGGAKPGLRLPATLAEGYGAAILLGGLVLAALALAIFSRQVRRDPPVTAPAA